MTRVRVHHLDCGTMCPFGGRLITGEGGLLDAVSMICHCLLVETQAGLLLVDTGVGTADIADPGRLAAGFRWFMRPRLDPAETAIRRIADLGFSAADVRHIVVTHLDLDHAGGLGDFPRAKVHVHAPEHAAAMARATLNERERYRPAQWAHGPDWALHAVTGDRWLGFEAVRQIAGLPPEVLIVPLIGHTRGHAGVAVETANGWLFHAGDAYFNHAELDPVRPSCPPALDVFQRAIAMREGLRRKNQARLRELAKDHPEVRVFSAHDPTELASARAAAASPAQAAIA